MIPRGRERDESFGTVSGEIASSTVALYFARKLKSGASERVCRRCHKRRAMKYFEPPVCVWCYFGWGEEDA